MARPRAEQNVTDDAEICSCSALRQAARHMTRLYDAALSPVGIGLNQYAILSRLKRFGPMRMGDLAGRLVMDRSTLGHLLRPLETRRVIAMHVGDRDRRSRMVGLTAEGDALCGRTPKPASPPRSATKRRWRCEAS
jgi:DNA-binding MarR family transcriptional regulator